VSTCDTTPTHVTAQIFYLIWRETLKVASSSKGCLKGNKLMRIVCKFHMRAYFSWQVITLKTIYFKLFIMCDLDPFSEIHTLNHATLQLMGNTLTKHCNIIEYDIN